jgi:aconitate hydratase
VVTVKAGKPDGRKIDFKVKALLNTPVEAAYFRNGGILHTVLRNLARG